MPSYEIMLLAAGMVFASFLILLGAILEEKVLIVLGAVCLVITGLGFAGNIKPRSPSWSTMRPIVKEAAAFPHRPPAIAADWRRLQAGHRLTGGQWVTFKHWVRREQEVRDKRLVERLTMPPASVAACRQTICRSGPNRHSAHDARDRGN